MMRREKGGWDVARTEGDRAGLPPLPSAENLRDVAGPGHPTRDGRRVRTGEFFRANHLLLSSEDVRAVTRLGLRGVHDLRRQDEVERHPDVEIPGATWHHHDVLGVAADDAVTFTDPAETVAMMERVYTDFVRSPRSRAAFGTLLRHLAHEEGAHLFHCTSGKDRTGWAAALLLRLAGVDEEVVLADYLLSNELTRVQRAGYEQAIAEALGDHRVVVLAPVLEVRPEYLALSTRLAEEDYGGLSGYLRDGLGLGDADVDALARRLRA